MKDTSLFSLWLLFMEWIKHVENVTTVRLTHLKNQHAMST